MNNINKLWLTIKFLFIAILIFAITQGTWIALLNLNLKTTPRLPWFVLAMGIVLVLIWKYLSGDLWSGANSESKRNHLRARMIPGRNFFWAIIAGIFSIGALSGLWIIMSRLFQLPGNITLQNIGTLSHTVVIAALIMGALVSALAEEFAFRGYLQGTMEKIGSGLTAVLIQAILISPLHGATQGFAWQILLWYFVADIMFGTLAYLTDSILPGVIIHIAGLLFFFTVVWPYAAKATTLTPAISATSAGALTLTFILFSILGFVKLKKIAQGG